MSLSRGLVLVVAAIWLAGCGQAELERRTEELRAAMETEMPLGSSIEDAEAFMRRHGIEEYSSSASRGGDSTIHRAKPELAEKTWYVTKGAVRNVYRGFLISTGIYPRFYFDKDKKLIWKNVEQRSDGL